MAQRKSKQERIQIIENQWIAPVWGVTAYNVRKPKIKPSSPDSREDACKSTSNQGGMRFPRETVKTPEWFQQKQMRYERKWHVEKCVLRCRSSGLRFSSAVHYTIRIQIPYTSAILCKRLIMDCPTLWVYSTRNPPKSSFSSSIPIEQWK